MKYVINGQKIFTSAIQYADYVWLAARTDPDAPKHKGLSVFIVPLDTPGFHWTPLPTIAGDITSSTFYEDVRVPAANLVGGENQGWKLITNQLNHERVAICPASGLLRSLTEVRRWAQRQRLRDGTALMDHEWVQISLARAHAKIDVLKLLNWKVAWASDKGLNPADASATKVYGTELALEVYSLLLEVVGQVGYLVAGSPGAILRGRLENQARGQTIFTFGGGTNEVQRDIVAMIGLGMPRAPVEPAGERPDRTRRRRPGMGRGTLRRRARTLHCPNMQDVQCPAVGVGPDRILPGLMVSTATTLSMRRPARRGLGTHGRKCGRRGSRYFGYAIDRRYLPVLLPFLLRPSRDGVRLTDDGHFVATFGVVKVTTPLANVTGAHVTEHYRWWTAVGIRMSRADDGLTFGTNNRRGVCIHFDEKVRSPLRRSGHSALTVTVADTEGLELALGAGGGDPQSRLSGGSAQVTRAGRRIPARCCRDRGTRAPIRRARRRCRRW